MPSLDAFRSAWGDIARGAAAQNVRAWEAQSLELDVDGVTTIVSLIPLPVPNQEAEGAAARSTRRRRTIATVARGPALFFDGVTRTQVEPGAFLFVAAGQTHRFEEASADLATWVIFYGPVAGEGG
jgi:hypothetical protein